jgi:Ca2+/Na+ antiporter
MNFTSLWLIALLAVCIIYVLWVFLKPKKIEQKRFSIKERRLKRQEQEEEDPA